MPSVTTSNLELNKCSSKGQLAELHVVLVVLQIPRIAPHATCKSLHGERDNTVDINIHGWNLYFKILHITNGQVFPSEYSYNKSEYA